MPKATARVDSETKDRLQAEASALELTESELIRQRVTMFHPKVHRYMNALAVRLNQPPAAVLEAIIVDRIARTDARREVYGDEFVPEPLTEFRTTDQGLMLGDALYEEMARIHRDRIVRDRIEEIVAFAQRPGAVIFPRQREFLERHNAGHRVPVTEAELEVRRNLETPDDDQQQQ